jgi:hypothetical protein
MATKLKDILGKKTGVNFEFVDMMVDEAQRDGSKIIRLVLKEPMDTVIGRRVNAAETGDNVNLTAFDVQMINIGQEAINEIDKMEEGGTPVFEWTEEGKSGKIKADGLRLDVSRNQEVWLVKTSLAVWGRQQQNERRAQQNRTLAERIRERNTRKEFGSTNVNAEADGGNGSGEQKKTPEPVASQSGE